MIGHLDDVLLRLAGPLKSVAGIVDDALEQALALCKAIHMPFVDELIGVLGRLKTGIAKFFDDLLEKLEEWAAILIKRRKEGQKRRKNKGDDPNGVPGGKPGNGGGNDNRKKAAKLASQQAWTALKAATTGDLEDLDGLKKLLKRQDERILGEKIDYAIDVDGGLGEDKDTWGVRAWAGGMAEKDKSHKEGEGWVAEPHKDVEGSKEKMYGATSAHSTNEAKADELLDAFEAAWQELCTDVDGKEHKQIEQQAARLADAVDAKLPYRELDIAYDFSKHEYGEDSTIRAEVVIAPNATEDARVLHAEQTDLEKLAAEKATEADRKLSEQVDDRLAPADDMRDLTDALDGAVTAEGTPEGTQIDIEAVTQGKDSWVVEATATLGDDKATKRTTDPHWLAKDRDGSPFFGKTNERARHVELMDRMTTDMEGELDDLAAEVDFANEPRLLELFADLADDIEPKASEAPYPKPTPDIRSEFSDLDLEAQEVTMDVSWSPNTGTTRRRIRWNSKASRLLQTAGREAGDVVEFLIGIALGDSYAGVDVRDFKNPEHEASWDYKVNGKRENMNWLKDRFRAMTPNHHEWVPMKQLGNIIGSGMTDEDSAIQAAIWIELAHELRAPTSDLVYQVASSDPFTVRIRDFASENPEVVGAELTEKMEEEGLYADDDDVLSGHVGAIYIGQGSERLSRPGGSHDFHTTVDGLWEFDKEPEDFVKDVIDALPDLLWDGDVKRFLSSDKDELEYAAEAIPSSYHDRTNTSWGDTLGEVGEEAADRRDGVTEALEAAGAGLP